MRAQVVEMGWATRVTSGQDAERREDQAFACPCQGGRQTKAPIRQVALGHRSAERP